MANLTTVDLKAALAAPGLIHEDVVDTVYNLDEGIPTPFIDTVRSDSFSNTFSEWTEDDLTAVDLDNAVLEGADSTGNDTKVGKRVGNHAQISDKEINISDTSQAIDSIGQIGSIEYQTSKRMMDLRRDCEGISLSNQASVARTASVEGKTAGFGAWLSSNSDSGTSGSAGGFNTTTKVVDAPTAGDARALAWEDVRTQLENVYNAGGNPSVLMSVPGVTKRINTFLFSDAGKPYRAAPQAEVSGSGGGVAQTAQGYISVVLSDFGIELSIVDNRLQQLYAANDASGSPLVPDVANVYIYDPAFVGISTLYGYRVKDLASQGHSERRLVQKEWMTKCFREDAHGVIRDVDPTAAVTAS